MEELHFTGNCLKGSRPILSFDASFDAHAHLRVMKDLLTQIFGVPPGAKKSKPFVDHVMGFTVADGKIWVRVYQVGETEAGKKALGADDEMEVDEEEQSAKSRKGDSKLSLVEIGPRFVLTPIVIQESSFGGPIIYENKEFVSPNQIRRELRMAKAGRYNRRTDAGVDRVSRKGGLGLTTEGGVRQAKDELANSELFG